jgi:hypothetical protein
MAVFYVMYVSGRFLFEEGFIFHALDVLDRAFRLDPVRTKGVLFEAVRLAEEYLEVFSKSQFAGWSKLDLLRASVGAEPGWIGPRFWLASELDASGRLRRQNGMLRRP